MSNAALDKATAKTREANQSYDRLYDPNPKFGPGDVVYFKESRWCTDVNNNVDALLVQEGTFATVERTRMTHAIKPYRVYSVAIPINGVPVSHKRVREEWLGQA